jgi:SP family xylose:H+ symportor-like MFS transporter
VRGLALSIAVFVQWAANFAVSQTFPMLTEHQGLNRTFNGAFPFWLFAIFCVAALVFVWKLVPETKKKALEEMDALWEK